jgi:hypothetical protein
MRHHRILAAPFGSAKPRSDANAAQGPIVPSYVPLGSRGADLRRRRPASAPVGWKNRLGSESRHGRLRTCSALAQTQRAEVVSPDVLQPLEKEIEIVVDGEITSGQAVAASDRKLHDQLRGAVRLAPRPSASSRRSQSATLTSDPKGVSAGGCGSLMVDARALLGVRQVEDSAVGRDHTSRAPTMPNGMRWIGLAFTRTRAPWRCSTTSPWR